MKIRIIIMSSPLLTLLNSTVLCYTVLYAYLAVVWHICTLVDRDLGPL